MQGTGFKCFEVHVSAHGEPNDPRILVLKLELCSTHESLVKFDSTLTQMSQVGVESTVKIKVLSRVSVESADCHMSQSRVSPINMSLAQS